MEKLLSVKNLSYEIDKKLILDDISLDVKKGDFIGLIGPNGCGKSTLLKNIYRVYKPSNGAVYLDDKEIRSMHSKEVAKKLAVVSQENGVVFDFTVQQMVELGRYAHRSFLSNHTKEDKDLCEQSLRQVGMWEMRERSFLSLSGGEKQRVLIASAFARKTDLIILDEPTNHLDIGYQFSIMDAMKEQNHSTIFASVHDMNIASQYCNKLIAMQKGKIIAVGTPREVLTPERLEQMFRVKSKIENLENGSFYIRFIGAAGI